MNKNPACILNFVRDGRSTEFLYTAETYGELLSHNFRVIEEQSYTRNFEKLGKMKVVPGVYRMAEYDVFMIYLIDEQGNIWQNRAVVGRVGVVDFANYNYLEKFGENLYQTVDGAQIVAAGAQVEQGVIEASNVQVVSEMVDMITITRAYEANQKIIQTIDTMLDKAVNQVGKL